VATFLGPISQRFYLPLSCPESQVQSASHTTLLLDGLSEASLCSRTSLRGEFYTAPVSKQV
jgi:hypothetical protein